MRTVSAEANYDVQSLQEAKIGGLVYTLSICTLTIMMCLLFERFAIAPLYSIQLYRF